MQTEIKQLSFQELLDNKDNFEVATDDYSIIAMDKEGYIYLVKDMGAEDIGHAMWDFLEIDAIYLDEEILDKADKLGY